MHYTNSTLSILSFISIAFTKFVLDLVERVSMKKKIVIDSLSTDEDYNFTNKKFSHTECSFDPKIFTRFANY